MTENRTVWKSDNQGVKEETFIQTSRRGRDAAEMERTRGKVVAGRPSEVVAGGAGSPTFAQINWEKQLGIQTDQKPREIKPQSL